MHEQQIIVFFIKISRMIVQFFNNDDWTYLQKVQIFFIILNLYLLKIFYL